jgi:acyl-CoA hydrolase
MQQQVIQENQRELVMSVLMMPDMANFSGNVHGGVLLKLLDQWPMPVPAAMPGAMW